MFFRKSSANKQGSGTQVPASVSSPASDKEKPTRSCTLCGKTQHEVRKLICAPSVVICDECVRLCNDILFEEGLCNDILFDELITRDEMKYDLFTQAALKSFVRVMLLKASAGLPGDHHFYVTFDTTAAHVNIPAFLKEQYPSELTIALQHQFSDLKVNSYCFRVQLSFGGQIAQIIVPFHAIRAFYDPSVKFALTFPELYTKAPMPTKVPANEQRNLDTPPDAREPRAWPKDSRQSGKEPIVNFNPRPPEMDPWLLEKEPPPRKPRRGG